MAEFFKNYGYLIALTSVLIFDLGLIPLLSKKLNKNQKIVKLAQVVQKLPDYITEAENLMGSGTGVAKLIYVLNKAHLNCLEASVDFDEKGFIEEIEKILSTPSSHGGK